MKVHCPFITVHCEKKTKKNLTHIFLGDLLREEDVLEWLVQNKNTASEEEDMIEDVTAKTLEAMTNTVAHLAVLFCKHKYSSSSSCNRNCSQLLALSPSCVQSHFSVHVIFKRHLTPESYFYLSLIYRRQRTGSVQRDSG